jgi:RimJ/RimL family protein N-acetyltransferase
MRDVIETQRLTLAPLAPQDAPEVARLLGDTRVAWMLKVIPHPFPPEDATAYIARLGAGAGPERAWAIRLRDDPRLIGAISAKYPATGETPRIGYWLDPAVWGRGIMSEAAETLTTHLLALGAPAVEAGVFVDNPASRRVLEKIGFAFAPAPDAWSVARGRHVPYALGRATPESFAASRRAGKRTA